MKRDKSSDEVERSKNVRWTFFATQLEPHQRRSENPSSPANKIMDVSIEYSHIYSNQQVAEEHHLSLEILTKIKQEETIKNHSVSLIVLIDDYSFPDPSFNYDSFTSWLSEMGFKPDFVLRESQLIPLCDEVLNFITNDKLRREISEYITDKKYPCSLFVASWYLLRLGQVNSPIFDPKLNANQLINILPSSFKPFEDKAIEIITSTKFADVATKINNKYFEGRKI